MAPPLNLVPPLATASPRLRFHLGEVKNNKAAISPILPAMPYSVSPYYVVQWNQTSYIRPDILLLNDKTTYDDRLGIAPFAFEAADGHAHVWIYHYGGSSWAYELYETGGSVHAGGGSNVFLSTDKFTPAAFDRTITVDFDAKLSKAAIYGSARAQASGAVLSQVFSGFGLLFNGSGAATKRFVFLQIPISDSRPISRRARFFCRSGSVWLYSPDLRHGERLLPYKPDAGPLHHFHYVLNSYLRDLLTDHTCAKAEWPPSAMNPRKWSVTGFYMGLETQTTDNRPGSTISGPQGTLETGFQIANIRITAR